MVTVRTYWNPSEAALAKSVLDDYEVPCVLLHENASTYYPLAMPARLVVPENQANRANQILRGEYDGEAEVTSEIDTTDTSDEGAGSVAAANRNPWELLVLAFYLLVPALCLLATKFPTSSSSSRIRYLIARANVTQFFSLLAVVFAGLLVTLYFRVRRSSLKPTLSRQS
jgi:hypothetical protein